MSPGHNASRITFASAALCMAFSFLFAAAPCAYSAPAAKAAAAKAAPAAKAPAHKTVTVNNSAALTGYWNRLHSRLQNNWQVPDGKNTVVLTVNVASDGATSDVEVVGHPKDPQAEVSATEAFNKSLPMEALPSGVSSAKITINFEYSYDPHGDGYHKISGQISQTSSPAAPAQPQGATTTEGAK